MIGPYVGGRGTSHHANSTLSPGSVGKDAIALASSLQKIIAAWKTMGSPSMNGRVILTTGYMIDLLRDGPEYVSRAWIWKRGRQQQVTNQRVGRSSGRRNSPLHFNKMAHSLRYPRSTACRSQTIPPSSVSQWVSRNDCPAPGRSPSGPL